MSPSPADTAINRAMPLLRELEVAVVSDPFAGLGRVDANRRAAELYALRGRLARELGSAPPEHPEVLAVSRRLEAVDEKIRVADAAWARAALHADVRHSWASIRRGLDGWTEETPAAEPYLPKTRLAVRRVGRLLADPRTHQIRDDNMGDPVIDAVYREAEEVFAAATAKLESAGLGPTVAGH